MGPDLVKDSLFHPAFPVRDLGQARRFGLIFDDRNDWQRLVGRVRRQGLEFYREPMVRYPGSCLSMTRSVYAIRRATCWSSSTNTIGRRFSERRASLSSATGIANNRGRTTVLQTCRESFPNIVVDTQLFLLFGTYTYAAYHHIPRLACTAASR